CWALRSVSQRANLLFLPDCHFVTASQKKGRAVFEWHGDKLHGCFSCHEFNEVVVNPITRRPFEAFKDWVRDPCNQTFVRPRSGHGTTARCNRTR
ncbi:MAG: hypothetical protein ACREDR_33525, partial [Blastocatellia bacterium]